MSCQTKYTLLSEWSLSDYRVIHFVKDEDSIVIVKKNLVSTKKIENNIEEIISGKIGKKISHVTADGKIYWFCYKTESQNGMVKGGEWLPRIGEETIYTYRSLPILVEKFPEN